MVIPKRTIDVMIVGPRLKAQYQAGKLITWSIPTRAAKNSGENRVRIQVIPHSGTQPKLRLAGLLIRRIVNGASFSRVVHISRLISCRGLSALSPGGAPQCRQARLAAVGWPQC